MNSELPYERSGFIENHPTPAGDRVHLIVAFKRPFDSRLSVPLGPLAIHLSGYVAELELALTVFVEKDESWNLFIYELLVPLVHLRDSEFAEDWMRLAHVPGIFSERGKRLQQNGYNAITPTETHRYHGVFNVEVLGTNIQGRLFRL